MRGGGETDEGRGSGRGGIHFWEDEGRLGRRPGVAARQRLGGGRWWLGDGKGKEEGGRGASLVGHLGGLGQMANGPVKGKKK
jgi:hypothetical protein